jgi:type I restriction enzyme M protein
MVAIPIRSADDALAQPQLMEAVRRGVISIVGSRIKYALAQERTYDWLDREEWVRAFTVSWLVIDKGYPINRIRLEVVVPRRTPSDSADIVVYTDDECREPYLVVETKSCDQSGLDRNQGIEQSFGNANSLRAPLTLYDEGIVSFLFDVMNFPSTERVANRFGDRDALPKEYGNVPTYTHVAGQTGDIEPLRPQQLEARIRQAHSLIWAGGRRDPLTAFDEWSKLLFAKVMDERTTPTGEPRKFQIGTNETSATIANRTHSLFAQACSTDPTIFPPDTRIALADSKISEVVRILQSVSFTRTDIDSIGKAFEQFFGSIFRGGLGQYFTMRQLARFVVATLDVTHEDFVLDPTAGSGGFLLESLLQVWHRIDDTFRGQPESQIQRVKYDFANNQVFGIEIHEVLARICKINLLLHHDGHTNIEANRSCLDSIFINPRLNPPKERFTRIVGNPPFGTDVSEGDDEQLGQNRLSNFRIANGLRQVASEQVIIERSIDLLEPSGRLGLVVPDGLLNNQGDRSNCPQTRSLIASNGQVLAIVSLPDHAFRKSGVQNKTSILFFEKFSRVDKRNFDREHDRLVATGVPEASAISQGLSNLGLDYPVFLAEANQVGYTSTGTPSSQNDLYKSGNNGALASDQSGTILHEWRKFRENPSKYVGFAAPDCMALPFDSLWLAHASNRLDPKYHLFKREAARPLPSGWVRMRISDVMARREEEADFSSDPDRMFHVMTISQTGEIRQREAGKGRNPPEWRATYFEESPGSWYLAHAGDVVFSSIDLWKGCIALVPEEFDGALVSNEFPIYEITDSRLSPEFLQSLLRSRYYQRAFRAITTGHSNRRRTQAVDFEALEIAFPTDHGEQLHLVTAITDARRQMRAASETLRAAINGFSDLIDGRGDEELPEINGEPTIEDE